MGLTVLKTPVRAPQANAFCERLIGSVRRECLDFVILFGERHVRTVLHQWVAHYNRGRPHASLGPGLPRSTVQSRRTAPKPATGFETATASWRNRSSADFITSIASSHRLREPTCETRFIFLRSTGLPADVERVVAAFRHAVYYRLEPTRSTHREAAQLKRNG
jgi:Integrase core domain